MRKYVGPTSPPNLGPNSNPNPGSNPNPNLNPNRRNSVVSPLPFPSPIFLLSGLLVTLERVRNMITPPRRHAYIGRISILTFWFRARTGLVAGRVAREAQLLAWRLQVGWIRRRRGTRRRGRILKLWVCCRAIWRDPYRCRSHGIVHDALGDRRAQVPLSGSPRLAGLVL